MREGIMCETWLISGSEGNGERGLLEASVRN